MSSWYCCDCQYGPHSFGVHNTCLECGTMRCDDCSIESNSFDATIDCCSHELPTYPSTPLPSCHGAQPKQLATMSPTTGLTTTFNPGLSLSQRAGSTVPGAQTYGKTYMYFCCQCGDGPKVFNIQPQCVICNHTACSWCIPAGK